ncbi:EsaB/YukD family protein [Streptomyces sp. NPDC054765]
MADEHCRVTVVGERKRVDLALPAQAPIAQYIPELTRLCDQPDSEVLPAAWSLALPGNRPFAPGGSLDAAGVVDGAVLYLRDVVEGEMDSPVVAEVEELVEQAGGGNRLWNGRSRAVSVLACALLALLTGIVALAVGMPAANSTVGTAAIVLGCALPLAAWAARHKEWPVSGAVRLAFALAACPLLALAGYEWAAAGGVGSAAGLAVSAAAGVNVGALLALGTAPRTVTVTVELFAVVTLPVAVLLFALRANSVEQAAVVAVVAFMVLSAAPAFAGRLATLFPMAHGPEGAGDAEKDVTAAVQRGQRTLAALTMLPSALMTGCLVLLGSSGNRYALGLTGCLAMALLLRAGAVRLVSGVLPVLFAGVCGVGTLALRLPYYAPVPVWAGPSAALLAGVVLLGTGAVLVYRGEESVALRPAWMNRLSGWLGLLSVPLAVAVFGLFDYLVGAGAKL